MTDTNSDPREYLRRDFKHRISGGIYMLFGIHETAHGTIRVYAADDKGHVFRSQWKEFIRQFELVDAKE